MSLIAALAHVQRPARVQVNRGFPNVRTWSVDCISAGKMTVRHIRKVRLMSSTDNDTNLEDHSAGVIMYCRSWCGDCARARAWLTAHNIPFTEIDVEASPEARDKAAAHNEGRLHTPTFEIGDGVCVDFKPDRLTELLDLD